MVILPGLFAVAGCNRGQPGQKAGGFPPALVTVAPVTLADVPVYLDEIGKTTADEIVTVKPQIDGIVIRGHRQDGKDLFSDGDFVTAGQELFAIDDRPFKAELDSANAQLKSANAQLKSANANLKSADAKLDQATAQQTLAKQELDRAKLLAATKAMSQEDLETRINAVTVANGDIEAANAAIQTANAAIDTANATIETANATIETAALRVEYCTIKSPVTGRAGQHLVDPGNVVKQNDTSLVVVQKIDPIWVDFTVAESDFPQVRQYFQPDKGLAVEVTSPDDPGKMRAGTLSFIDNTIQDGSGTIKLRASVKNDDQLFWPGQFVRVRLILTTLKQAALVPAQAIQLSQQGSFVYVLSDNAKSPSGKAAAMHLIKAGQRQGDKIVIAEGVKDGDQVITDGAMLFPDAPVRLPPPGGFGGPGGSGGPHAAAGASPATQPSAAEAKP